MDRARPEAGTPVILVLEASRPFQWKPGSFKSRLMYRAWWGWFAIGWVRVSFREFIEAPKDWTR